MFGCFHLSLKHKLLLFLSLLHLTVVSSVFAFQVSDDFDYLPQNQGYLKDIPKPQDVFGYPVGTWHARHDQIVRYMHVLAESSPRVQVIETGRTHEHRQLILVKISAPDNIKELESLREKHIQRILSGKPAPSDAPTIINMGYSVHGNESSAANSALLVAYHLAASQSEEVSLLLQNSIILIDPVLNPDGHDRFAQWANMHRGQTLVSDPKHREHVEHWPSGRTNHYWFDLNRDWLLLSHPESKARVEQFQKWRPHVLTDFHEMGTNSTYFFQPGISSRKNPWTPDNNVVLTQALANFHADALDKNNQLYFTQESFDDFYYGKGSTYPDAQGSIGILFEQASSRGHLQESINGLLSFPATIKNQVITSLSTFEGVMANRAAILAYQKQFFDDTKQLIRDDEIGGYLIQADKDTTRFERAKSILSAHNISFLGLSEEQEYNGSKFTPQSSIFVPTDQLQYRLIRSLFSERKRFLDNTFYDVSNWNLPLAFNLSYESVSQRSVRGLSLSDETSPRSINNDAIAKDALAYVFEWHDSNAPTLLYSILSKGLNARLAGHSFNEFESGSIMITRALAQPNNWVSILINEANRLGIQLHALNTGLTAKGIDLGSRNFEPAILPSVLLIGGKGTSQYEVGEIRHYFDTRVNIPVTLWDLSDLPKWDIDRYTHLIFASGNYQALGEKTRAKIEKWVRKGGVLIGQKSATAWFAQSGWLENKVLQSSDIDNAFNTQGMQFSEKSALAAKKLISGAVYNAKIDRTHPLFFGYGADELPFFKTSNLVVKTTDNPFENIAIYDKKPLLAGYTSNELQALVGNTTAVSAKRLDEGVVIGFTDNINFRGYWDGTSKLLSNSLFMSPLM